METRYCPQCGTPNAANFHFCQKCGASLSEASLTQTETPVPAPASVSVRADPRSPQPAATSSLAPHAVPAQPVPYTQQIGQMGTGGLSAANIWGPFAGYGERGRHVSWLLDNQGDRAEQLRNAVTQRFGQREIPGARVQSRTLTGKGIVVERRPYYLVRRGIATAGLYIARFGRDLYISQVTYAKGPINPLRVLILALMVIFQLYIVYGYTASVNSALQSAIGSFDLLRGFRGGDPGVLGALLCCIGPLGAVNSLALVLAGLHMVYKFLADRDPFALLRTPPNEFEQDDIIALEKSVEETVRQSLDTVGIDAAQMPPASQYGFRTRLI